MPCGFDSHSGHSTEVSQLLGSRVGIERLFDTVIIHDRKAPAEVPTLGTRPIGGYNQIVHAQVAKLVDALVLGTSIARCEGSSPFLGTLTKYSLFREYFVLYVILFVRPVGFEPTTSRLRVECSTS